MSSGVKAYNLFEMLKMKFLIYLILVISTEELYDFRACFQEKMKIRIVVSLGEAWESGKSQPKWERVFRFLEDFELIRNNYDMMQQIEFVFADLNVFDELP